MFDEREMESAAFAAMKVRAMIKLIEEDGGIWIERVVATGNIGMTRKKVWSRLRESPVTILRRARKIVSLNKQD